MEREMIAREGEHDKWVYDSSVDHKGRLPSRASTGSWKAALFIITTEFSERLSFFGLSTSLISYLTKVIQQDLNIAAKNVNYWSGVTTMMPLIGGFLADAYTGRFSMIMISSAIYLVGLGLLVISRFIPALKPCGTDDTCHHTSKVHEITFFVAMYFISIATGGYKPCLESFGADQFDVDHEEEKREKMSYFNWWNFSLCCGLVLGVTLIVYLQQYVGWGVADLILILTMALTIIIFYLGKPFYRFRMPQGSPLKPMLQVVVAAIKKRNLPHPSSPDLLYEVPKSRKFKGICHTNNLKFLDRAAIIEENENLPEEKRSSPWRLATVTRVEELKLVLNMIPIWLGSLAFGTTVAQSGTFFIKQSSTMNRKIGHHFEIPPATIYALTAVGLIIAVTIYDKVLVPALRRATGNERGISILQRIGFGMIFSVLSMSIAGLVERKRLSVVARETIQGGKVSMSVFWLAPQFLLLGVGDAFTLVGLQEYFYDQVPDSMRSLGIAFYLSVLGVGNFLSSFLITVVSHVTEKISGSSWFGKDLNTSHVDNFYWLLAAINVLNICVFVVLARRYPYKNVQGGAVAADLDIGDEMELVA